MAHARSHFSTSSSIASRSLSLRSLRQSTSRVDGKVVPPKSTSYIAQDGSISQSLPPAPQRQPPSLPAKDDNIVTLIKQRSQHFRQKSRASAVPGGLTRTNSAESRYSQDSAPSSPKEELADVAPTERSRTSLRAEKVDQISSNVLPERTAMGWPRPRPTSSMEVRVGQMFDEEEIGGGTAEELLEMAIKELSPTKSGQSAVHGPRPAQEVPIRAPTLDIAHEVPTALSVIAPVDKNTKASASMPESASSKRHHKPPPLSLSTDSRNSSEDMPPTPKDVQPLRLAPKEAKTTSIMPPTPATSRSSRSRVHRPKGYFVVGDFVLFDAGAGWTHGMILNRSEKKTVKRNDAGFFETSMQVLFAIKVGQNNYAASPLHLKHAPTSPPLYLCNEQVLASRRGLHMHAKTVAIRMKKRDGAVQYIYTLSPMDKETADHRFEAVEDRLRKLPCSVDTILPSSARVLAGDKTRLLGFTRLSLPELYFGSLLNY